MAYRVELDTFHGPLDLLLYLVQRDEVDVLDIPIARVTGAFLDFLRVMTDLDFEQAGEFVVMAATLMEIKGRALVPDDEPEAGADGTESGRRADPRRELVRQLLEYRRFKEAAQALEARAERHAVRVPRTAPEEPGAKPAGVRPVELWDLVSAFARLVRETQPAGPTETVIDDTPQRVYEEVILGRLRRDGRVRFPDLFSALAPPRTRSKLLGLFLAALEVIRRGGAWVEQPEPFGDIWLSLPR